MRLLLAFAISMIFFACKQSNMTAPPNPNGNQTLKTDSSTLHLAYAVGVTDSFTVISNTDWNITVTGASTSWLHLDKDSGSGNARIHLTALNANLSDTALKVTLKISIKNNPAAPAVNLPINQAPADLNDTSRNAYGGSGNDQFFNSTATADGGFIAVGLTNSPDGDLQGTNVGGAVLVMRMDKQGKLVWKKKMGNTGYDIGFYIIPAPSGGYLVCGSSGAGSANGLIIKIDEAGNVEWQNTYNVVSGQNGLYVAMPTSDGGYLLGGDNGLVLKIDGNGNKLWGNSIPGGNNAIFSEVISPDNNYVMCGQTGYRNGDYWVIKLDTAGNLLWQKTYGGTGVESLPFLTKSIAGGYIITGGSASNDGDASANHGGTDCLVIKIDENGNKIWSKMFGGSNNDEGIYIAQTMDGHYIIAGSTSSSDGDINTINHGAGDGWVFEIDESGNLQWQKTFGGSGAEFIWNVNESSSGNFAIDGWSPSADGDVVGQHGGYDGWLYRFKIN